MHIIHYALLLFMIVAANVCMPNSVHAESDSMTHGKNNRNHPVGLIRISGDNHAASLLQILQAEYTKVNPGIIFKNRMRGNASAIYGLEQRTADIAVMSRKINPFELYGVYERSWVFPIEIEIATGSHESSNHAGAYAIFVHRSNPIESVTISQLDGIFGAQRTGGWKGLEWDISASRGTEQNIRSWHQLGVKGKLGKKTIHPYAPPITGTGTMSDFQVKVLRGGAMWSEELREYQDNGVMLKALSEDPQGIAYGHPEQSLSGVKMIAVAEENGKPAITLAKESVSKRKYPLSRALFLYYTIDDENGNPVGPEPNTEDFIRFILSEKGQNIIERHGDYNRLKDESLNAQTSKIEETTIRS